MSNWRVIKARDDEGNHCIYLQQGSDKSTRELFEFVEPDVMVSLPQQYAAYLEDAEAEVESRNADEDDGQ
ncbi:hypothetical protein SNE35_25855 [Paucibacter sp. R3-3]|uniref:Uncharacterized protein n=1 Tax=Roseateles agri TaxID=3098619 RepID=A0ABU5DNS1_9BURK|nr:hypothetical protein [Paucibacter sp. R3-3]MDY0747953.1 hypothetical protein [Paucibacter sp. R3-3]